MLVMARTRERGMTIVEVVVAATILTIVLAAVVTTVIGAGHAQQRAKLRQQMAASASHTLESLHEDKAWISSLDAATCGTAGCPITLDTATLERITKDSDGREFEITAIGWPVDSDGDGIGAADTDRITPDYVRVSIRVTMSNAQQLLFGTQKPFTIISTIDLSVGRAGTGTLVVQTCEASAQTDERTAIDGCDTEAARVLAPQPTPCRTNPALTFDALVADRTSLALGCNDAIDGADDTSHAQMIVRPVTSLGFRIVQVKPDGSRSTRRSIDAEVDTATGRYTFTDLPAGTWTFEAITPAPGREHWASKAMPSALSVTVPEGRKASALLVQRPVQGRGTQTVRFTRTVYTYETTYPGDVFLTKGKIWDQTVLTGMVMISRLVLPLGTPTRDGTAYDGVVGTEAKPAGRYVDQSTGNPAQRRIPVTWDPSNGTTEITFDQLGSGLHDVPDFIACTSPNCGTDQTATVTCMPQTASQTPDQSPDQTPQGCTPDGVWIDEAGTPDSTTLFHSPGGECYLDGKLVDGGRPRGQEACDEAVEVNVKKFLRAHLITGCYWTVGFNPDCSRYPSQKGSVHSVGWSIAGSGVPGDSYLDPFFHPCGGVLAMLDPGPHNCDHYAEFSSSYEADSDEASSGCYPPPKLKITRKHEDEDGKVIRESVLGPPYGCVASSSGQYMACRDIISKCTERDVPTDRNPFKPVDAG